MIGKSIWVAFDWLVRNVRLLGVAFLGAIGIYWGGRRTGRKDEQERQAGQQAQHRVDTLKDKDEVRNEVDGMSGDGRRERLRKYNRD